jgi:hypothetical protein
VDALLKDAEEMFTAAWNGGEDCEMAILVSPQGAIHMLPCSGWGLEPLRIHHGASTAYRIRRSGGTVSLEARSGSESCTLRAERPAAAVRPMLMDFPRYSTVH